VRRVDPASDRFNIAREYMIRLRKNDFANAETVAKLAAAAKLSADEFTKQFAGAVAHE
jgi:6-phosphofructokinase 1